jgi:hypothetical protein
VKYCFCTLITCQLLELVRSSISHKQPSDERSSRNLMRLLSLQTNVTHFFPTLPFGLVSFFSNYTIHRRHSQRTRTHLYEYTHANLTPRSIFEDRDVKFSRLTKSPQTSRYRGERRLPLKAQTPLNPEKFAPTRSRTQDLRCYRGSCDH